jgi:hypothetical protein
LYGIIKYIYQFTKDVFVSVPLFLPGRHWFDDRLPDVRHSSQEVVTMEYVLSSIYISRGYDKVYQEDVIDDYDADSYNVKNVSCDDHDLNAWKHVTKDLPCHQRKKARVLTKKSTQKKSSSQKSISRKPSVMKSIRYVVNDFHL